MTQRLIQQLTTNMLRSGLLLNIAHSIRVRRVLASRLPHHSEVVLKVGVANGAWGRGAALFGPRHGVVGRDDGREGVFVQRGR
jgi:hypothetical protein